MFAFHIRGHHLTARKNEFIDLKVSTNEVIGLPFILLLHLPFLFWSPVFFAALAVYAGAFIILHNYQHRNPEFTKKVFLVALGSSYGKPKQKLGSCFADNGFHHRHS